MLGDPNEPARQYAVRHLGYPLTKAQWDHWHNKLSASMMSEQGAPGESVQARLARLGPAIQAIEQRHAEQQELDQHTDDFNYDDSFEVRDTQQEEL
jgi:hypothetical protein